jgi:hypothetical protein
LRGHAEVFNAPVGQEEVIQKVFKGVGEGIIFREGGNDLLKVCTAIDVAVNWAPGGWSQGVKQVCLLLPSKEDDSPPVGPIHQGHKHSLAIAQSSCYQVVFHRGLDEGVPKLSEEGSWAQGGDARD